MREISLDTETTGLNPKGGDRVVEIGCVEMINHIATDNVFHVYINPQRDMPDGAFKVHGLSEEFLRKHDVFSAIADDFLDFIGDSPLVIHNAQFDIGFLNAELTRLGKDPLDMARTIDTVPMARKKFPGAQANLDALCRRFGIDNSNRQLHGALLDAELLAEVYLELNGGRQTGLGLGDEESDRTELEPQDTVVLKSQSKREARVFLPSAEELERHEAFIGELNEPIWKA
ncbi:MAG: DNA polymerase III subunit epsilon [Rhodospirillaceae bacterium]|nr:MAG: DNA polymerase III subunit epsilon [Rhodospirillaceae bacterium]